ncbi:hypothetical protein ACFV28_13375 [Streptomyces sp. NPDC059720]|uniref:hypothetical protein n=1 Tax=Streptomyces sp. NPDC059720 TaxID=3346924 RepID=UPI0036C49D9C
MSSTRRALKHKRNKRRAETEQLRTARRDTLSILLSRAQRGVLSRDEAALLRTHVEAELAEGDTARQSERGQQRAMERHRQRVEAAELAIVEAEQRAEQAEERLAAYVDAFGPDAGDEYRAAQQRAEHAEQQLAAYLASEEERHGEAVDPVTLWPARAVEAVRTARRSAEEAEEVAARQREMHEARRRALADALAAPEGTQWPQLVALARRIRHDAWANGRDCREAHERARALEGELTRSENARDALRSRLDAAEQRTRAAEQALDRVRQADTLGAAVAAVAEHDGMTPQAAAVHAAFTNAADSARARLEEQAREHAVELAQLERRANGWARHAIAADDRLDRALAAWRSARTRAAKRTAQRDRAEQALATAREERDRALDLAAARGDALAAHLATTEAPR